MIFDFMKHLPLKGSQLILNALSPNVVILGKIVSSTEKDFLAIGEKLQEFHGRASEISGQAAQIAEKISGREMDEVHEGFNRISAIVEHISGGMQMEKDTIHVVLNSFNSLRQPLAEFDKVVRILNVLANFIKIEIACLGLNDTSFHKLSEDVGRLANLIGQKINSLTGQVEAAISSLNHNITVIENCDARQKVQYNLILEKISADLSIISEKHSESSKTVHDISTTWESILLHVGEVVQSLQIHDITRQRVEHVREVLDDLLRTINIRKKAKRNMIFKRMVNHPSWNIKDTSDDVYHENNLIADTFELQAAQLQGANHDLHEAVGRILQHLQYVANDATAISGKIISATGQDGYRKDEFIARMEKDINYLADSTTAAAQIRKDLSAAMADLSQTAMGMSVFMKDVEKIGIEMQRLALNAGVHAAHLGEQGGALSVLAGSIQQLSLDTSSMVQKITSNLQMGVENAAKLGGMTSSEGRGQLVQMHEDCVMMLSPLKKIESEIGALLPSIEQSGILLAYDIEHLLGGIHIHEIIGSDLTKVAAYLCSSADKIITHQGKRTSRLNTGSLQDLSAKYTMHRERETHMASMRTYVEPSSSGLAGMQRDEVEPEMQIAKNDSNDGLGDNVELF